MSDDDLVSPTLKRSFGLPPGTVVHVGHEYATPINIEVMRYTSDDVFEQTMSALAEIPATDKESITWINITGVHDTALIEAFGSRYDIHPLILEDIAETTQRPRFEDMESYIYIVLNMMYYRDETTKDLCSEQVSMILRRNLLITFQEHKGDVFDGIRNRIRNAKGRVRRSGADYLAYILLDTIIDNYFKVLEDVEDDFDAMEERVVDQPDAGITTELRALKMRLGLLRRTCWPLREMVRGLGVVESKLIAKATRPYFRDLFNHSIHVSEAIESLREVASDLFNIYLSNIDNQMQKQMKVLTVMASLFVPLTFITGIYGMNFEWMPFLKEPWGFAANMILMGAVVLGMLGYFRFRKWI